MTQSTRAITAAKTLQAPIDPTTVRGWGTDADAANDPTRPMRDRTGAPGLGTAWNRPERQITGVEILQSVEHIQRPAVVGESTPPSGLSGSLRRAAFGFSESQWGHWLLLMLADRINSVEGLFEDIRRGVLPNPLVETGVVSRRHARPAALVTVGAASVALVGLVLLARARSAGRRA